MTTALQAGILHSDVDVGQNQRRPVATVPPPAINGTSDLMPVDETKDRIYIHDLESELADIDGEESGVAFLPEIEKKLAALPTGVIGESSYNRGREMVLYQVPSSISVPQEQDHVRKAIIAARARARNKQISEAGSAPAQSHTDPTLSSATSNEDIPLRDREIKGDPEDAMDID